MQKYISFLHMTEKGLSTPPEKTAEVYSQMMSVTEKFGGKTLEVWTGAGKIDFVAISEFPTDEAAFEARVKLNQLGIAHLDGTPTFPIESYLAAASGQRIAVPA